MSLVVDAFKMLTLHDFKPLAGNVGVEEIESIVGDYINQTLNDNLLNEDIEIIDIAIYGSRARGIEHDDSDLDIVVEYRSSEWKEDAVFNLLNQTGRELWIEGVKVDINPITANASGSMEEYLANAEKYLFEKKQKELWQH